MKARHDRPRKSAPLLLAAAVVVAALVGAGPTRQAEAVDPLTYAVGRAVTRFLFGIVPQRARDYREINRNRDGDLREVADVQRVRDYQRDRGWLDAPAYQQEQQRLTSLSDGIVTRAEREKRITKYDYDHAIGREARTAVQGALTSLPGVDPTASKFVANMVGGADPLSAAIGALQDPSQPVPNRLAAVEAQLRDTQGAFNSLRNHLRDPKSALKLEVDRMRSEAAILADPGTGLPQTELEQRVNRLQQELAQTRDAIKGAWKDLTGTDVKIDNARFARDDKWLAANANVQALKDTPDATKAVLAAMIRERQESAENGVKALLTEAGLPADDAAISRMASESISEYLRALVEARRKGEDPSTIDRDQLLRNVVNRGLAASGQEPLPEPGKSPAVPPGVSPSPSVPSPTVEPPTATPEPPTPTATPLPPTATAVPPTPTAVPPTPTLVPTPTATPASTQEPILPTIVVSGGFTDGQGFATTFTITIDFKSGGVSGSIRGGKSSEWTVTCTDPAGNVLDVAAATETDSYQAGVAGGVGSDGGFSASFSGKVAATVQLTRLFTHPGCVGREPALPAPSSSPIGGTLSGVATVAGSVSVTSSLGGSWAGAGSVQ